ncbi:hypothetical protein CRUP_002967 [Coryphaenoides rupestris]|nr:hypothetical protein CRUP_002967 [Coryphaenoides rupestris]
MSVCVTRMTVHAAVFCLICLLISGGSSSSSSSSSSASSHVPPPPRGCGVDVEPPYRVLCDLDTAWGVVLEAVACAGVLTSLILSVVLLVRLRFIGDPDRRSGLGPLLLLLATLTGLFSLSLAYLVGKNQALCVVRRALWGPLFALCFSCLLVQGLRLRKLVAGKSSPAGGSLAGLGAALALVQGIISGEWVLLTVVREGHPACDYPPVDFALTCAYTLGLLLVAMGLSLGVVLCGGEMEPSEREEADRNHGEDEKKRWRCNGICFSSAVWRRPLLWVACAEGKGRRREKTGQESVEDEGSKGWDEPHWPVACIYNRAALRGTYRSNQGSIRPGIPFRGHVYQPTEMALVMNGGAMPTAPINYTGRQLW